MSRKRSSPTNLYHYTNSVGLLGIIQKGVRFASDVSYMNDNAEIEYAHSVLGEVLNRYEHVHPFGDERSLSLCISDLTELRLSLYRDCLVCAACFCEDGDLLSQWRGYAPNNGFSIGFARKAIGDRIGKPFPVEYSKKSQLAHIELSLGLLEESLDLPDTKDASERNFDKIREWCYEIVETLDYFKSKAFREEREWRLRCYLADEEDPERMHFRASASGLVPYMELDVGIGASTCVSEIVVGPTTYGSDAVRAVELLLASTGADHVSVRSSGIALRNYGLHDCYIWVVGSIR